MIIFNNGRSVGMIIMSCDIDSLKSAIFRELESSVQNIVSNISPDAKNLVMEFVETEDGGFAEETISVKTGSNLYGEHYSDENEKDDPSLNEMAKFFKANGSVPFIVVEYWENISSQNMKRVLGAIADIALKYGAGIVYIYSDTSNFDVFGPGGHIWNLYVFSFRTFGPAGGRYDVWDVTIHKSDRRWDRTAVMSLV